MSNAAATRRPSPNRKAARLEPWRLFLRAHAAVVDRLERELLEQSGLPLAWYEVLLRLASAPEGRLRMTDLSRSLLLSKSGATRVVDRMEEAGLVTRETCPSDRRGFLATLTRRGRSVYEKAAPIHLEGVDEHFLAHLTGSERRAIASAFEKVLAANDRGSSGC